MDSANSGYFFMSGVHLYGRVTQNMATVVPIAVPEFAEVRKSPLANSGAYNAALEIIYWLLLLESPVRMPNSKMIPSMGIKLSPRGNNDASTTASANASWVWA